MGHEISVVAGRKTFSFKGIPEYDVFEGYRKDAEEKYRAAFDGFQKGIVQTTRLKEDDPDSPIGWIDEDGQVLPFPEVNYGKSFVMVKTAKVVKAKK